MNPPHRRTLGSLFRTGATLAAGIGLLLIAVFAKLSSELAERELDPFDRRLLSLIANWRRPALDAIAVDVTSLGSVTVLVVLVAVLGVVLAAERRWWTLTQLLIAAGGATVFTSFFKGVWERDRPSVVSKLVDVPGFSYPSGHSLAAASIYVTFALLAWPRLEATSGRVTAIVLALMVVALVGASRMYLGVHYPSDVLAGVLFGMGWALLVGAAFQTIRGRYERARSKP